MTFGFPYALLMPFIIGSIFLFRRIKNSSLPHPGLSILKSIRPSLRTTLRKPILGTLSALFIILLSLAAARPHLSTMSETPGETRDLMLVLDLSGSMKERDFSTGFRQLNRLEAVKLVVAEFLTARTGDRIGLAVFGTQAFLQSPLTTDHSMLIELLNLLQLGVAGEGTAIGDGLGVALKSLKDISGNSKAIILLTDGANNSGQVSPLQAATIANKLDIKIHTIGIGSADHARLRGAFGQSGEYDEKTLREIASLTGGIFFNASDLSGLKNVYSEIDKLEKREQQEPQKIITKEYYPQLTLSALLTIFLYTILSKTIFLKVPEF